MATKISTSFDFQSAGTVTGLTNPSASTDAATKAYVDSAVEGLAWKDSARVATQGNLTLASPGATIDGITMVSGDRVLVRAQSAGAENGIYIWNGAAVPATRSLDANTANELEQAVVTVEEGTSAGVTYRQTAVNFTLDSGAVSWSVFGTAAGNASETSAGIAEIATQAETDAGTDDLRFVTPLKLATSPFAVKKYASDFGDGSSTSFNFTHNFGTRDVLVEVILNSGNYDTVLCDVQRTSINQVTVVTSVAPASNAYRVLIRG